MSKILVDTIDTRSGTSTLTLGSSNAGTIALGSGDVQSNFLHPAFMVYKGSGTNQTISNDTFTKVEFSVEDLDTNNNFASDRFTPTTAGKYLLFASVACDCSASDFKAAEIQIRKNGSEHYGGVNQQTNNNANHINMEIQAIVDANGSSDYFEIFVTITDANGSPVINAGGGARRCRFGGFRIAT